MRPLRTIDVDRPIGRRLALWMCPVMVGARTAIVVEGHIFYSPAMAWLLCSYDTQEEWDEMFRAIPMKAVTADDARRMMVTPNPDNVNIPTGPLDKGRRR